MPNEVYQPQELETTVPEMSELTAKELSQQDRKGLETLLYIIRGLGIDRDRFMTIAEFVNAISGLFANLRLQEGEQYTDITSSTISGGKNRSRFSISTEMIEFMTSFVLQISKDGFSYNGGNRVSFAKYDTDGYEFEITKDGLQLKIDNGSSTFNIDKYGISFERGGFRGEMTSNGFVIYYGESVIFEVSQGNIVAESIKSKKFVQNEFLLPENTSDFTLSTNWQLGEVKCVYFQTSSSSEEVEVPVMNAYGENYKVTFKRNTCRILMCVGFAEDSNGVMRAKLQVNG